MSRRAFVVGLTGGIGAGKSTVAGMLAARGARLIDTDAISRELTAAGGAAIPMLREAFGTAVIAADGALARDAMRDKVFADPAARVTLESIVHPLIRENVARALADTESTAAPYTVLDVPLLFETMRFREAIDRSLAVDCPGEMQVSRVMRRSALPREAVVHIMAAQISRAHRLQLADDVLVNIGDAATLAERVARLHDFYCEVAARGRVGVGKIFVNSAPIRHNSATFGSPP